jgi:hypothetical protein
LATGYCQFREQTPLHGSGEAENQARRLSKMFYPETVTEDVDGAPAEPVYCENLSLF